MHSHSLYDEVTKTAYIVISLKEIHVSSHIDIRSYNLYTPTLQVLHTESCSHTTLTFALYNEKHWYLSFTIFLILINEQTH